MASDVHATDDAAHALTECDEFLATRPGDHNVVHTLLAQRAADPKEGRYWVAHDRDDVAGVAFLSPLDFFTTITPAAPEVVDALVDVMSRDVPNLLGVIGDVATAARFAGEWAARRHVAVEPLEAERLYGLRTLTAPTTVPGAARAPRSDELDLLVEWDAGFAADTGEGRRPPAERRAAVARLVHEGRLTVWEHDGAVSMATLSPAVAGSTRVQLVYTPPARRGNGYASAGVAAVSLRALAEGATTVVLYTQLSNPTSNSIYSAIGYEPIAEILRYRFR